MNSKITPEHLDRGAVVYVRQSTITQVMEHTESQRAGAIGAVYCLEASRLARNGRDWHHLIDLCALVGTLVVDGDGVYDPRLVNDRLLLGLKGTMSEYELSLLRQRGLAARDSKAKRGELRFTLLPGYCWGETGRIEMDPDERVVSAIRMVFVKFRELGSARQVLL